MHITYIIYKNIENIRSEAIFSRRSKFLFYIGAMLVKPCSLLVARHPRKFSFAKCNKIRVGHANKELSIIRMS